MVHCRVRGKRLPAAPLLSRLLGAAVTAVAPAAVVPLRGGVLVKVWGGVLRDLVLRADKRAVGSPNDPSEKLGGGCRTRAILCVWAGSCWCLFVGL